MNPGDVIAIGALVLALDRVVALVLGLAFLWGIDAVLRRHRLTGPSLGWWAMLAGLAGARIGYVAIHWQSFALEPWDALRAWLGGWYWPGGVLAALFLLVWRLRVHRRALIEAALLLGLLGAVWAGFLASRNNETALRLPPELAFETLDGRKVALVDYRGKPLILNLWATWCPPCRRETPMLARTAAEQGQVPLILVNQGEARDTVGRYAAEQGLPTQAFVLDPDGSLGALSGSGALPTTLLIGPDGTVLAAHMGEINRVQIDILVRQAQR